MVGTGTHLASDSVPKKWLGGKGVDLYFIWQLVR